MQQRCLPGRLQEGLAMVAGTRYKLVADLASCMREGGAGFYARQRWAGGGGIREWCPSVAPVVVAEVAGWAGAARGSGGCTGTRGG